MTTRAEVFQYLFDSIVHAVAQYGSLLTEQDVIVLRDFLMYCAILAAPAMVPPAAPPPDQIH